MTYLLFIMFHLSWMTLDWICVWFINDCKQNKQLFETQLQLCGNEPPVQLSHRIIHTTVHPVYYKLFIIKNRLKDVNWNKVFFLYLFLKVKLMHRCMWAYRVCSCGVFSGVCLLSLSEVWKNVHPAAVLWCCFVVSLRCVKTV